jgi:site-specific recombinase XerD
MAGIYILGGLNMITDKQIQALVELTEQKATRDKYRGRTLWVRRWLFLHLLIGAKLSVKEITELRICDVHLNCSVNYIKSYKGTQIMIDNELAEHISEYIRIKQVRGEAAGSHDYLLTPSEDGRPYTRMAIYNLYHSILKKAGIPKMTFNDFLMSITAVQRLSD